MLQCPNIATTAGNGQGRGKAGQGRMQTTAHHQEPIQIPRATHYQCPNMCNAEPFPCENPLFVTTLSSEDLCRPPEYKTNQS